MKKSLVSALAALAMVVGGVAPAAHASVPASNPGAFTYEFTSEYGTLSSPSVTVGNNARGVSIYAKYVPNASAWSAIQGGNHTFTYGSSPTFNGAALNRTPSLMLYHPSNQASVQPTGSTMTTATYAVPAAASVGNAFVQIQLSQWGYGPNTPIAAGTYAFTPTLAIDGVAITPSDWTITYSFSKDYSGGFTADAQASSGTKSGSTCVDTTGYSAGDVLTVTALNNGAAGYLSGTMSSDIGLTLAAGNYGSGPSLASLSSAAQPSNGVYTYTLTNQDLGKLLLADVYWNGNITGGTAQSLDLSVTKGGVEVSVNCFPATGITPAVTHSGSTTTLTSSVGIISGFASQYDIVCRAYAMGPMVSGTWSNGACTFTNTSASTTYSFMVELRLSTNTSSIYSYGAFVSSAGAVGAQQVVVVTPVAPVAPVVPVFKQPKFAMPSKIDVDATGKVSLSGKDMGVSTVLIGGKEQKIDTNSDEKLVFDTTGLAKGVHDLVMKGAFGTYTIQKAIQVGEAVVTKVAAVSARQVGMAGGELSISGQGLEGTTQITMNGQVLEIVSRTDSKVTFKVPASTVASVNSIMIEGSFVPVIFKNAFSYTK
jgi:hypothetical protein